MARINIYHVRREISTVKVRNFLIIKWMCILPENQWFENENVYTYNMV